MIVLEIHSASAKCLYKLFVHSLQLPSKQRKGFPLPYNVALTQTALSALVKEIPTGELGPVTIMTQCSEIVMCFS